MAELIIGQTRHAKALNANAMFLTLDSVPMQIKQCEKNAVRQIFPHM